MYPRSLVGHDGQAENAFLVVLFALKPQTATIRERHRSGSGAGTTFNDIYARLPLNAAAGEIRLLLLQRDEVGGRVLYVWRKASLVENVDYVALLYASGTVKSMRSLSRSCRFAL